jgi:hypothetical protein
MRYAYVQHGVVQEAWSRDPFELFDAGYASLFVACPDDVQQGWTYDGSTWAAPAPEPTPIPRTASMRQARLALLQIGKLSAVDTAIAALPSPAKEAAQIEWEYATEVTRDSALMQQLAAAIGLTEADLDSLFTTAAGL